MSALVRLSAALPGDPETNGLDHLAGRLSEEPADQVVVALVWFDVSKVTYLPEQDAHVPTVRVRKVEPIGESHETRQKVADLYAELQEARLGRQPLPFDQLEGSRDHVDVTVIDDEEDEGDE